MNLLKMVLDLARTAESVLGDWYMNVTTHGAVFFDCERGVNQDSHDFENVAHCAIRKTIKLARPTATDVVYVLGSGQGRAVCHFARQRVQKVVGIEISQELCEVARHNARKLRNPNSPIEIRNADVTLTDISDGTIFFMFNPFGEKTLRHVLTTIATNRHNGFVRIIYMNAQFSHVFKDFTCFEIAYEYRRGRGQRVVIYRNNSLLTDGLGLKENIGVTH
jgi:precorrin-6B methylase 2